MSQTNPNHDAALFKSAEAYKADDIISDVETIAADLRELATRIESIANTSVERIGQPSIDTYAGIAARIHRELYSTLASSKLVQLVRDAGEADAYRAKAEAHHLAAEAQR